ncbi:YjbH domain-containing protein [Gammaproteobacteria bacterium]|nr:YjbH domain-containing protein [Gammaproteobacteria bacterium]
MKKNKFIVFYFSLIFLTTPLSASSYNSFGQTGLIYTPSAEVNKDQSAYFTFTRSGYMKLGTLTVTPFNWLEASYFYYRPDDLLWGARKGLYLDKGFNVKFSYKPKNIAFPTFAIGLDDFAGTGQFTREYVASTYNFNNFKLTTGVGWGKYAGVDSFKNPLSLVSDSFSIRPLSSSNDGQGGQPNYDLWFKGPSAPLLGIEYRFNKIKNLSIKIEHDPYDYFKFSCCGEGGTEESKVSRLKDMNTNLGFSYKYKDIGNLDLSIIKGNTWNLSFSIGFSGSKNYRKKAKFNPVIKNYDYKQSTKKNEFYLDLLNNLNSNKIYLQTADLDKNSLSITVESEEHLNPVIYTSRAAFIANESSKLNSIDLENIEVGHLNRGIKINSIQYNRKDLNLTNRKPNILVKRNTKINDESSKSHHNHEFKPRVNFPVIINQFLPDIKSHVGSPERFLYTGIGIKASTEIQFSRNIVFYSEVGKTLVNNFDRKSSVPNSSLANVRTNVVDYLQQGSKDFYISNMVVENIWSPYKNIYAKLSIGYLESMYGGTASEIMFKPFNSNTAFSYEYNNVRSRDFDQKFTFSNYRISTNHFNLAHYHPKSNILLKWSYGNYLASDTGYTLDLSRRMPNGWQAGFWFSNTNVSAQQFGEGSFDKGFYIHAPLSIFSKNYRKDKQSFSLRSMTRDGAQKLELRNRLIDSFYGSTFSEINENWSTYLD